MSDEKKKAGINDGNKRWFTGNGPFSAINYGATEIRMAEAASIGFGGIGLMFGQGAPEDSAFIDGVVNYHHIAAPKDGPIANDYRPSAAMLLLEKAMEIYAKMTKKE